MPRPDETPGSARDMPQPSRLLRRSCSGPPGWLRGTGCRGRVLCQRDGAELRRTLLEAAPGQSILPSFGSTLTCAVLPLKEFGEDG